MTLAWSSPDALGELELHIESPAGARTMRVATPRVRLPSGALAEGTHTWWYATKQGSESRRTTVMIRFDNAAPIAQFFRAAPAQAPAGTVPIDGVALEGAKVSAAGRALAVDDHGRFRGAVSPLPGDDAVAVRLDIPYSGVHYYVRRRSARRAPPEPAARPATSERGWAGARCSSSRWRWRRAGRIDTTRSDQHLTAEPGTREAAA